VTVALLSGTVLLGAAVELAAQEKPKAAPPAPPPQKFFPTPEAAVDALIAAFKSNEDKALLDIFGHEHDKLVLVTDKIARGVALMELHDAAIEKRKLQKEGDNRRILILGKSEWPLPIPIVKEKPGWRFDTEVGEDEIINRRIGANELQAIANCRAYLDVQAEYARKDRDDDEVREYAQKLRSTKGKKDGLYWPADPDKGEELSPAGPLIAHAAAYLKVREEGPTPFKGYYYKVLTRQGSHSPGGKHDYIINGNMIAGFALLAWPADYDSSGIMTFVVSHQGKVYEKDLGEKTGEIAAAVNEYNPDKEWKPAQGG